MELRPHQKKALDELSNGKVLRGGVGSGKTLTAVSYYLRSETPRDVFVITTAKKRDSLDWQRDFADANVGRFQDETAHGVLTVDSWNNIQNYKDVRDAFFIFDEQRAVGSGAWAKSFVDIARNNRWIMLSATPGDTWLDYIPIFLANGFYKNRTHFLRSHVVFSRYAQFPKVERFTGEGTLVRYRDSVLVEMPFERHTKRHPVDILVEHNAEDLERITKDRWNIFEDRPLRDIAELFSAARRIVNTDQSRLSTVRDLMAVHPRLIVFYNFDYELEMLRTLASRSSTTSTFGISQSIGSPEFSGAPFPCDETSRKNDELVSSLTTGKTKKDFIDWASTQDRSIPNNKNSIGDIGCTSVSSQNEPNSYQTEFSNVTVAEWNGHKHQEIPQTDRWVYLVQYTAGAEGWNCITTDAIVFWSANYSWKLTEQARGRIDRMNTPYTDLYYYMLSSDSWIDKAVQKALKTKKSFNEYAYAKKHWPDEEWKVAA